jgi:predicted NBD/HSP70 family sugar kinase
LVAQSIEYKREIVRLLRRREILSRTTLSELLGLSFPTISTFVRDLMRRRILADAGLGGSRGGRKPGLIKLNPGYVSAVGIELSASRSAGVAMDLEGKVFAQGEREATHLHSGGPDMKQVYSLAEELCEAAKGKRLAGVGVGVSGIVDKQEGASVKFPYAEDWDSVPLVKLLSERARVTVLIDNDVQATTRAELFFGGGKGVDNFLYLHLGRGIGLGIVTGGNVYNGSSGNVGELGHTIIEQDGPICYCGNYGCLESLASPPAIVAQARQAIEKDVDSVIATKVKGSLDQIELSTILEAAEDADRLACNLLEKAGRYIGLAAANAVNLLNPELLLLGGTMAHESPFLVDAITRAFKSLVMPHLRETTRIELSLLEGQGCALGAASTVLDYVIDNLQD